MIFAALADVIAAFVGNDTGQPIEAEPVVYSITGRRFSCKCESSWTALDEDDTACFACGVVAAA